MLPTEPVDSLAPDSVKSFIARDVFPPLPAPAVPDNLIFKIKFLSFTFYDQFSDILSNMSSDIHFMIYFSLGISISLYKDQMLSILWHLLNDDTYRN